MKKYEKSKNKDEKELRELSEKEMKEKANRILKLETTVVASNDDNPQPQVGSSVSNMNQGKDKELPSFWIPNLTPSSKMTVEKPSSKVLCPMSGKPLKASHLIPIHFTPVDSNCTDHKKVLIVSILTKVFLIILLRPATNVQLPTIFCLTPLNVSC